MRRHMKLVRLLLEHAEAQCNGHRYNPPELKDYGASEVEYHVMLCQEAGYHCGSRRCLSSGER